MAQFTVTIDSYGNLPASSVGVNMPEQGRLIAVGKAAEILK